MLIVQFCLDFLVVLSTPWGVELAVDGGDEVGQGHDQHWQGGLGVATLEGCKPENHVDDVFSQPQSVSVVEVEDDHDGCRGTDGEHQGIPQWVGVVQGRVDMEHGEPGNRDDCQNGNPATQVEVTQLGVEVLAPCPPLEHQW